MCYQFEEPGPETCHVLPIWGTWSRNMSCATNLRNLVQKHAMCYQFEEPGPETCHVLPIWEKWSRNMSCATNLRNLVHKHVMFYQFYFWNIYTIHNIVMFCFLCYGGRRGYGRMVVEFTTTCALKLWVGTPIRRGVQHYVIKFVSYLRQVGGFLRVLRFPPLIKLTSTI